MLKTITDILKTLRLSQHCSVCAETFKKHMRLTLRPTMLKHLRTLPSLFSSWKAGINVDTNKALITNDISFIDSSRDCHVTSLPMYSHIRFLSYTGDRTYTAFAIKIYRCCSKVIYSSYYQVKYNLVKHLCRKSVLTVPLQVASFYTILTKTRCEQIFDFKIIYITFYYCCSKAAIPQHFSLTWFALESELFNIKLKM